MLFTTKKAIGVTGKSEKTIRVFAQNAPLDKVMRDGKLYLSDREYLLGKYPSVTGKNTSDLPESELVKMLKAQIEDLQKRLDHAHQEKLQMLQSLRVEQIKTLPEKEKQRIMKLLEGEE